MRLWWAITRNPDQYSEECQHKSDEAYRESCLAMDEYGNGGECEGDGGEDCPKHLAGRDPLWNQSGCIAKKERLTQRKGNRADAESNAATRPNALALAAFDSDAAKSAIAPQDMEKNRKKLPPKRS
jgi:hypothetical protein